MREEAKHRPLWERPVAPAPAATREALRERFHKVILSRGYSEIAAQGIIAELFERYMCDVPQFLNMLREYERGNGNSS